jgi:prophage DNA circulation protein
MEREYDLFEVLSDGAVLWRQMAAGRDNAVRKLTELSKQTSHEIRVMHVLTNTLITSMNGPRPSVRPAISTRETPW